MPKNWLLAQNDQPEYGARPLKRIIARHLREPLADFLLTQGEKAQGGVTVQIDTSEDGSTLTFDIQTGEEEE